MHWEAFRCYHRGRDRGIVGNKIGEGGKAIVKTAAKVAKGMLEGAVETVKCVGRMLNPLNWLSW